MSVSSERCNDLCGLRPERWVVESATRKRKRSRVVCKQCGRFIGYTDQRNATLAEREQDADE